MDIEYGFIGCYRPPHNNNENLFFESIKQHVANLESSCADVFIVGYLNYNMLDENRDNNLADFMSSNGFSNTIRTGTRLNPITGMLTLLDVILCMNIYLFICSKCFFFLSVIICLLYLSLICLVLVFLVLLTRAV